MSDPDREKYRDEWIKEFQGHHNDPDAKPLKTNHPRDREQGAKGTLADQNINFPHDNDVDGYNKPLVGGIPVQGKNVPNNNGKGHFMLDE